MTRRLHDLLAATRRAAVELAAGAVVAVSDRTPGLQRRLGSRIGAATLFDLTAFADLRTGVREVLRDIGVEEEGEGFSSEYLEVVADLGRDLNRSYPERHRAADATLEVLYKVIRSTKPSVVLETGVADGWSTEVSLQALHRNGRGVLHSVDINEDVGCLVTNTERWHLHVLSRRRRRDFRQIIEQLPEIDFYFHDGDHSYAWQRYEYDLVAPKMSTGGTFASDDVDASRAFLDFARESDLKPALLLDGWKIVAIARLT